MKNLKASFSFHFWETNTCPLPFVSDAGIFNSHLLKDAVITIIVHNVQTVFFYVFRHDASDASFAVIHKMLLFYINALLIPILGLLLFSNMRKINYYS